MGGRHIVKGVAGFALDTVANALGITTDEVRTALQSGQSIADLAVSKGKTAAGRDRRDRHRGDDEDQRRGHCQAPRPRPPPTRSLPT